MKQRVFALLLLVWCVCAMPAAVGADTYNFGWTYTTGATSSAVSTTSRGMHGGNAKVQVYHAGSGDVLDSIYVYAGTPSGTHSLAVGLYTLSADLLNLDDRVLIDTIDGYTTTSGWLGIDVNYSMTAKTWYGLAICSVTASTTNLYISTNAAATEYPSTNPHTNNTQTKTGMLPDPWSTFGTNFGTGNVLAYGVVQQGTISGTRGSVSFVSVTDTTHSSAQTSIVITKPASIQNGDVLVAAVCKGDGYDASAIGAPAGWVPIHASMHTTDGNDCAYWVGYKIITNAAGEGSTYTWTGDNEEWTGGIMAFRGVDTANILDCSPKSFFNTGMNDDSCRSITTRTDSAMVIAFGVNTGVDTGSVTMPSGFTQAWFEKVASGTGGNATTSCGYDVQETKGATGIMVLDYNDAAQGSAGCVSLALRPASTGAATTRSQVMRTLIME